MILKFDDIIYSKDFQIQAKDKVIDLTVEISDKESEELASLLIDILAGKYEGDRLDEILFKDKLAEIKEALIGFNFVKFQRVVLNDFQTFMNGSIDEAISKANLTK